MRCLAVFKVSLPPTGNDGRGRILRNRDKFKLFKCRTAKFDSSFLPSGVKVWNALPINIQNSTSLNCFRRNITKHFGIKPSVYTKYCRGPGSAFHARLRMGLSALNQHRFTYNFIPSRTCDHCDSPESTNHFFHDCTPYAAHRQELHHEIAQTFPTFGQLSISKKTDLLLLKDSTVAENNYSHICQAVHTFLLNSRRFEH